MAKNSPEENQENLDLIKAHVESKRPWYKKKRFIIPLGILALIIIISSATSGGKSSTSASSSTSTASASASASATKSATPTAPAVPAEYKSALTQAGSYSKTLHMCKAKLYDQLVSKFGGQFSAEAAQYAVDNVVADWNANALALAKSYQSTMAMSPAAIRTQLTSDYGEKCTAAQADYAVQHLND